MIDVNIMIGRFQPITRGHLKCFEATTYPTVVCMIETKEEKLDEKHPFPSTLIEPLYRELLASNKNFKDIILVKNANIVDIVGRCKAQGYNPKTWTCGTDRYDSYSKMASKYAERCGLDDDFKVIEIKRSDEDISATKLRTALKDDNKKSFLKDFPQIPLKMFMKIDIFNILRDQLLNVINK